MSTPDPYDDAADIFKSARAAAGFYPTNETVQSIVLATLRALQEGYLQRMATGLMEDYESTPPNSPEEDLIFAKYESYLNAVNRVQNIRDEITEEYK
jgi:hypothetical protein